MFHNKEEEKTAKWGEHDTRSTIAKYTANCI